MGLFLLPRHVMTGAVRLIRPMESYHGNLRNTLLPIGPAAKVTIVTDQSPMPSQKFYQGLSK